MERGNEPYGHYKNAHCFEGAVAYTFSKSFPLSLSWGTRISGADKNEKGHMRASTYISALYPIAVPAEITLTPSVGFTPWKGMFYKKAAFTDISLKASKDLQVSSHFSMPLFIQVIVPPAFDRTYLVAGFCFGF
ncbi:MAG: hypothetical protein LUC45_00880 [Paraprevotella sp.]|nr:hypothetical protein [Paraprevotella sp.]